MTFGKKSFLTALLLAICTTISVTAWSSLRNPSLQGSRRERVIEKAFTRNEVVEFKEVQVSQKTVALGQAFDEDDDWLSRIDLTVKNISTKPIVYLAVNLDFPETKATGSEMSFSVSFGQQPGSRFPQKNDPIFMLARDSFAVPLNSRYAKLKTFIEHRQPIGEINKVELRIHFVVFADKTAWGAGNFYRQDPADPDHYINVGDIAPNQ